MQNIDPSFRELDVARYNTIGILTSTDHRIGIQYIFDTFGYPVNLDDGKSLETDVVYNIAASLIEQKKGDINQVRAFYEEDMKKLPVLLAVAVNYGRHDIVRDIFVVCEENKYSFDINRYGFLQMGCYPIYNDKSRNDGFQECAKILLEKGCDPDKNRFCQFRLHSLSDILQNFRNDKYEIYTRGGEVFCLRHTVVNDMSFNDMISRNKITAFADVMCSIKLRKFSNLLDELSASVIRLMMESDQVKANMACLSNTITVVLNDNARNVPQNGVNGNSL